MDRTNWANNGSAAATEEHYQRAIEAYRALAPVAERAGITITLEVHMNTIHDTAASAVRLLDAIGSPAVRANLDAGNMWGVRRSEHPVDAVSILRDVALDEALTAGLAPGDVSGGAPPSDHKEPL